MMYHEKTEIRKVPMWGMFLATVGQKRRICRTKHEMCRTRHVRTKIKNRVKSTFVL